MTDNGLGQGCSPSHSTDYHAVEPVRPVHPSTAAPRRVTLPEPKAEVTQPLLGVRRRVISPGSTSGGDLTGPTAGFARKLRNSKSSVQLSRGGAAKPRINFRTTKTSLKLALFPDEIERQGTPERTDDEAGTGARHHGDVYNQLNHLTEDPTFTGRVNAELWRRLKRDALPRVTAYCTATSYDLKAVFRHLQRRRETRRTMPILLDECLYSPFVFSHRTASDPDLRRQGFPHDAVGPEPEPVAFADLLTLPSTTLLTDDLPFIGDPNLTPTALPAAAVVVGDSELALNYPFPLTSEIFVFDYGVVVFWAMTAEEEQRALAELRPYEMEPLNPSDHQTEDFNLYYNSEFPPMIYNDVIRLRHPKNHMVKLAISHAIAQSVKLTLYEELVDSAIEDTKHIPQRMAKTGRVKMSRTAISRKIGQLFIMRINVNLVSNILDTPEIFWSEPALQPLYDAIRGYLEITQRADIMNHRVSVISDLLVMLREHLNGYHGEFLEWIIIILIAMSIGIGLITITFEAKNIRGHGPQTLF
ncbi:sporulation protein rmd1 [Tieghemiomyces parasiticus]|uniref:Sporulation protein rmd1 n=1 Tax=Tieghemiomyces parasiticus TaxID=78921 RepID=A0A9W8DJM5_9FUNG|nr:sporulation protein rmd1 [Tieghemiomyces parasiticus]